MKFCKSLLQRIAAFFITSLIVFSLVFPFLPIVPVFADSETLIMDDTAIEEDLAGLDFSKYPKNPFGTPSIFSFQEYCYSDDVFNQEHYALYVYVYNPACKTFVGFTGASSVLMANEYATNEDGSFAPGDSGALVVAGYKSFALKLCSAMQGANENLFVKFRVMNVGEILSNVKKMEKGGYVRRYDVAEIQLFEIGAENAMGYPVTGGDVNRGGRTYFFNGYSKGFGAGAEIQSTLRSDWSDFGVVDLEVAHTSYKTGTSAAGKYHQNELQTVYFSVDNRLINEYGRLQKIAAQWYEYKMTPSIVASAEIYEKLLPYVGLSISKPEDGDHAVGGEGGGSWEAEDPFLFIFEDAAPALPYPKIITSYAWGISSGIHKLQNVAFEFEIDYAEDVLKMLFCAPEGLDVNSYTITGESLIDAAKTFAGKDNSGSTLPIKDGTVPADCFLSEVDEGRTFGYNKREFDADCVDDQWNLLSYADTHNWWQEFWDFGFGWHEGLDETLSGVAPIYTVSSSDMAQEDDEALSKALYIDESDVAAFRDYYAQETAITSEYPQGKSVVLFRFAATDYFSAPLVMYDTAIDDYVVGDKEVRQGTAFLDFEMISLTFDKDGTQTVLGVVSSPIDFIGDYTPAQNVGCSDADIKKIFAILVIVLFAAVVIWIIKKISNASTAHKANAAYRATRKKK